MIEAEIFRLMEDPADTGLALNDLVDTFRCGRSVREILPLLDSDHVELVSIATWILGEIAFELYDSDEIITRLQALLNHREAQVRFNVLGALFPTLARDPLAARALLAKLANDPNEGVRMRAQAASRRLSLI